MQHPFSKSISIKSRLSEHLFIKCGKQEKDLGALAVKTFSVFAPSR
jgi:hypothetical protein